MKIFQIDISDLVDIYNYAPQILQKQAIKVSLTENSLIHKSHEPIILTSAKNGNYWIIATAEEDYWLFPKDNIKIDNFNLEAFKYLFDFDNYNFQTASLLTLVKPARISLMPNGREWKLEELGEADFIESPPSIDLQMQLELANQEVTQLQSQFSEITRERNLLQDNLEQLRKNIQQQRDNYYQQLEQATLERQRLVSLIEIQLNNEIGQLKHEIADIKQVLLVSKQNQSIPSNNSSELIPFQKKDNDSLYLVLTNINWLKTYNQNPELFAQYNPILVSITADSIDQYRLDQYYLDSQIIIEKNNTGIYQIVPSDESLHAVKYLVPKANFIINQYTLMTLRLLFQITDESLGHRNKLIVVQPASAISINKEKWQLVEPGINNFEKTKTELY
ncbi:hypothetical protein H6G36_03640 [Anabaena minutissima FACHB-250]|nr:hypothetical protein [Anabaena minutissima FACHB-250]